MARTFDYDSPSDRSSFFAYLVILLWAPLPLASNRLWSLSLLCIMIFAVCIAELIKLLRGQSRLSMPLLHAWPLVLLLGGTVFWTMLQALPATELSISPTDSLHHALLGTALLIYFCLTLQLLTTSKRLLITGYTLVGSGLFQAVYGGLMTLSGYELSFLLPKDSYIGVSTGTFINRNSQASYLVMVLSIGIGLMISTLHQERSPNWREVGRRLLTALLSKKIILRLSLLIIVAGLVMTHSRMGNSSFFISLFIIGTIGLLLMRKATRGMFILLLSLFILDLFVLGTFFGVEKVAQRLQKTSLEAESRDEVLRNTAELTQAQAVTGTGAGTFYTAFPEYRTQDVGYAFYVNAHNDFIELLSEWGMIGTIPAALVVFFSFLVALYAQYKRRDRLLRGIAFGSSLAILAMAIHSTVDFNLQIPANALTFMLILALPWIALFKKGERSQRQPVIHR